MNGGHQLLDMVGQCFLILGGVSGNGWSKHHPD